MKIPNGCILVARVIQESDIWRKPSDWFKVLIYIVLNVNYEDSTLFKRGENMFKYDDIARACRVSYNTVVKFVKWSVDNSILATQKTTRGIVIKVLNYELYQDLENYKSNTKSNSKATQKQLKSNSILKEEKETIITSKEVMAEADAPPSPPKVDKRRGDITSFLVWLKGKAGVEAFADSKIERNMAKTFLDFIKKTGKEEFIRRLDVVLSDDFKKQNRNRILFLYNEVKSVPVREPITQTQQCQQTTSKHLSAMSVDI